MLVKADGGGELSAARHQEIQRSQIERRCDDRVSRHHQWAELDQAILPRPWVRQQVVPVCEGRMSYSTENPSRFLA